MRSIYIYIYDISSVRVNHMGILLKDLLHGFNRETLGFLMQKLPDCLNLPQSKRKLVLNSIE